MSGYKILITQRAFSSINECVSFVMNVSYDAAKDLYKELIEQIYNIGLFPERYPEIDGLKIGDWKIRKMPVHSGRYNVLYRIEKQIIYVMDIIDSRKDQILNRL